MKCIFCKDDSSESKSVEHIVPESMGNIEHVLRGGIVCDNCNQYFATKIEKQVLGKPYFISARHRNLISNKRNRIPSQKVILGGDPDALIDLNRGSRSLILNNSETIDKIIAGEIKHMIIPVIDSPEPGDRDISRLLGKIAIEALAYLDPSNEEWISEIVTKEELDQLRSYVRYGTKPTIWQYHQRRIYNEQDEFQNLEVGEESYEILHEFKFLFTENSELYFVISLFGLEFALNFGESSIDGYKVWLNKNNQKSPLFDIHEKRLINTASRLWNPGDQINFMQRL